MKAPYLGNRVNYTRRHPRYRLGSRELNGQMTFASEVSILDVGMGGVSLTADKRLNIGGRYTLKLEANGKVISLSCEVAWARLSATKRVAGGDTVPLYTAGMKFVGLSSDNAADLQQLLHVVSREQLPRDEDRRKHPRVPAEPPGLALLNFPARYQVRTISLSGMLIESADAVEGESRIPMALSLPDGRRIEFLGRVVSCRPNDDGGTEGHHIGIEFVDLTDASREALGTFIGWLSTEGAASPA